jgi:hypothetical protein
MCAARTRSIFTRVYLGFNQGYGWRRSGRQGICFQYECLQCAIAEFVRYFDCATHCSRDPSAAQCTDCSYTYEDSHAKLLILRGAPRAAQQRPLPAAAPPR